MIVPSQLYPTLYNSSSGQLNSLDTRCTLKIITLLIIKYLFTLYYLLKFAESGITDELPTFN